MIIEVPEFKNGVYIKPCILNQNIMIGSINCVGHPSINLKKCDFCHSYKEENTYYLEVLKEHTPIVSEVFCNRLINKQLQLF